MLDRAPVLLALLALSATTAACTKSDSPTGTTSSDSTSTTSATSAPSASMSAAAAAPDAAPAAADTTTGTALTAGATDAAAPASASAVASGAAPKASASASAAAGGAHPELAAANAVCGVKPQPDCPLQAWMKANTNQAVASSDLPALAIALDKTVALGPAGYTNWASIAKDGAKAAKAGDLKGAKASCRTCHDQYKAKYKADLRGRKI